MAGIASQSSPQWSSRFAFIMAAVGSSVGLGNLWRFSAEAGRNGGGAFIMIYLACVLFNRYSGVDERVYYWPCR